MVLLKKVENEEEYDFEIEGKKNSKENTMQYTKQCLKYGCPKNYRKRKIKKTL